MLNPSLYAAAQEVFADVRVKDEGDPGTYSRKITIKEIGGFTRRYVDYHHVSGGSRGETYVVNCPFCDDHKHRLYISYLFGRYDLEALRHNWGNVHCFHHACHESFDNRMALAEMLQIDPSSTEIFPRPLQFSESRELNLSEVREIGWPGLCEPVHELPPEHPARRYLSGRGLDVEFIGRNYGVQYLSRAYRFATLNDRIVVPLFRKGQLVGWSARTLGRIDKEVDGPPKWLHSPGGMSGTLYGLASAMTEPVAVVVEGPIDKWAVGFSAFALMGKTLGGEKQARLRQAAAISPVKLFVVLLDPKMDKAALARKAEHHSDVLVRSLRAVAAQDVIDVRLPQHMDPGCSEGTFLAKYLYQAVRKAGYADFAGTLARSVLGTSASRRRLSGSGGNA